MWKGRVAKRLSLRCVEHDAADQKSSCKINIMRPGQNPADMFDWCANNKMKLIWVVDCIGDKDCCIDKAGGG